MGPVLFLHGASCLHLYQPAGSAVSDFSDNPREAEGMSFFKVENLTAGYGGKQVVNHLSFELEAGSLTGLLGANGSGKSTLLKALCGILPHRGSCMLEKQFLEELSSRELARLCSYIPQRSGISIDISVLAVVLMGFNPSLGLLDYPPAQLN